VGGDESGAGRSGRPPRVAFAARLLASKDVADYAEAVRRVRETRPEAEFLVAGTPDVGNPDAVPSETIQRWHDEGVVRWLGDVDDMSARLAETEVLLEGAAAGCGLVASDTDGCHEVIDHGRNGLLVPPRDPEALAVAIRSLLDNPDRREKLAAEARRDAVERFDLDAINEQWVDLYQRALR
jgi:glycosyltransferase involved in cell wall biosynthesis